MLARPELDEVSKVLIDAAEHIRKYGWCKQGGARPGRGPNGERCVIMAIWDLNRKEGSEATLRLVKYLGLAKRTDIITWNDVSERTKEQVIDALLGAAYSYGSVA